MQRFVTWRKNASGAVAIEFALVVLPFLFIVLGIIELALMFTASSVLESATQSAARVIRTGQVQQTGGDPLSMFEDTMCGQLGTLIPCGGVVYEVLAEESGTFGGAASMGAQYDGDGNMISRGFDPGGVSDVVVVRASYNYQFKTPSLGSLLSSKPDNSILLMATVTLRNEPYEF